MDAVKLESMSDDDAQWRLDDLRRILDDARYPVRLKLWLAVKSLWGIDISEKAP